MDNWEKILMDWWENTETEIQNFCEQMEGQLINTIINVEQELDQWTVKIVDELTTEADNLISEFDVFLRDFLDLINDNDNDNDDVDYSAWFSNYMGDYDRDTWQDSEDYPLSPNPETHPACVGCQNYHGRSYNGNLLVCGIHPYGWEGENCPDWTQSS